MNDYIVANKCSVFKDRLFFCILNRLDCRLMMDVLLVSFNSIEILINDSYFPRDDIWCIPESLAQSDCKSFPDMSLSMMRWISDLMSMSAPYDENITPSVRGT